MGLPKNDHDEQLTSNPSVEPEAPVEITSTSPHEPELTASADEAILDQTPAPVPSEGSGHFRDTRGKFTGGGGGDPDHWISNPTGWEIIDLVSGVRPIIDYLKGIDVGQLRVIMELIGRLEAVEPPWNTEDGVRQRLRIAIDLLRAWSQMTPGGADDKLAEVVDRWSTNPILQTALVRIITGMLGLLSRAGHQSASGAIQVLTVGQVEDVCTSADTEAVEAAKIQWEELVIFVELIGTLLGIFKDAETETE